MTDKVLNGGLLLLDGLVLAQDLAHRLGSEELEDLLGGLYQVAGEICSGRECIVEATELTVELSQKVQP